MFLLILYKYIESLKWIILIAASLCYFRKEIKGILNRPFSVSHGGTTVNFPIAQQTEESGTNNTEFQNVTEEQIENIKKNLQKKESEIQDKDQQIFKLTLEKHFEYTYRLIFRSQIQLLQNLQVIGDGFSILQLEEYFQNIRNTFTALSNWNLESYLKFLYDQNFIARDNLTGKVKLTPIGDLFLKYLIINSYNFNTEKGL
jgi:hypothetical protein